jgi:hypothetical protein
VDNRAIFEAWAPSGGRWSRWAKTMLFANLAMVTAEGFKLSKPSWVRRELGNTFVEPTAYRSSARAVSTAIVADLPGAESIAFGLAVAELGVQPVPLYNSLPASGSIVPMEDVMRGLIIGAASLAQRPPPVSAPPAFLLDARRTGPGQYAHRGQFDNRSLAFETDFPSAAALASAGINQVVLVQALNSQPAWDLTVTLAKWQDAGVRISLLRAEPPFATVPITVRAPGFFARLYERGRRRRLRGDPLRGFGGVVPHGG